MSAPSPAPSSGLTPNGGPPLIARRPKKADPLVRPKRKTIRKEPPAGPGGPSLATVNGNLATQKPSTQSKPQQTPASHQIPKHSAVAVPGAIGQKNGSNVAKDPYGFSEAPASADKTSYWPLYTTKRDLIEGMRHHIVKFASKKVVDPTNEKEFIRPVRLHRRDPRAPPAGAGSLKDDNALATDSKDVIMDEKDRAKHEILQQQREAQKQADLAQIAPTGNQVGVNKRSPSKKKTRQVYRNDHDPEAQKASKLRYEEALPWHLEDFDNKNVWVGNYESALSDMHVALTRGPDRFNMVPVEKWYKFTAKNQFKTLTIEEAELRMSKKVKEPRWFMESQQADSLKKAEDQNKRRGNKLFLGKMNDAPEESASTAAKRSDLADVDELDFEEDRFADDEENQLFEGEEEEAKEAETRIKRDQLQANVFDLKDEKEYDREAEKEKKETELAKKLGRSVRKALMKREKNYIYDDDTDENPYTDKSESEDTEEEMRKEEERKKAGEKADKTNNKEKESSKQLSGASTRGTNTPLGRNKQSDPLKKSSASLKRPGSPNLSEASGTESTRKKSKKKHGSSQPTATPTPNPQSRATSPAAVSLGPEGAKASGSQQRSTSAQLSVEGSRAKDSTTANPNPERKKRARGAASSGSDEDATGGETGDGTHKNRSKRARVSPRGGSPQGSRAASPNPPNNARQGSVTGGRSRAGSPAARSAPVELQPITDAEVIASIPPEGTTIAELLLKFRRRVGTDRGPFIKQVRQYSTLVGKKLLPRPAGNPAAPAGAAGIP